MDSRTLTEREEQVLHALVEAHVDTGVPVGSRTLCGRESWRISSATVRAVLQRLEEKGLVQQRHRSAGRVPTDRGYRLYVAQRMRQGGFTKDAQDTRLEEKLQEHMREGGFEEILGQLAQILGDVSNQLGVVMAPRFERGILQQLELVGLEGGRILLLATIRNGLVRSLLIQADARTASRELEKVSRLLNERLAGLTLAQIRGSVRERLAELEIASPQLVRAVTHEIEELTAPSGAALHVAGAHNICLQPEFHDPMHVAELMALVERRQELAHWLGNRHGMVITIGRENGTAAMRMCSVVSASYEVGGAHGVIGVIGPTRMPYGRLVNLVSSAACQAAALAS